MTINPMFNKILAEALAKENGIRTLSAMTPKEAYVQVKLTDEQMQEIINAVTKEIITGIRHEIIELKPGIDVAGYIACQAEVLALLDDYLENHKR